MYLYLKDSRITGPSVSRPCPQGNAAWQGRDKRRSFVRLSYLVIDCPLPPDEPYCIKVEADYECIIHCQIRKIVEKKLRTRVFKPKFAKIL